MYVLGSEYCFTWIGGREGLYRCTCCGGEKKVNVKRVYTDVIGM